MSVSPATVCPSHLTTRSLTQAVAATDSNAVGPVANNFIINNKLLNNRRMGLSAGGYGHAPTKMSLSNVFAANLIQGETTTKDRSQACGESFVR